MNKPEAIFSAKYESDRGKSLTSVWMSIFTSTYQREKTLSRVYESLLNLRHPKDNNGKLIEFEWIIVDDGSTDGTGALVKGWCEEDKLPIRYYWQENKGKHVAVNFAVRNCRSEMFLTIDSDDTLLPNALETFYYEWQKIVEKEKFKGLTGRCVDPHTGGILGTRLPHSPFDVNTMDMRLKYHIRGEMCGFNRVDLMKLYPFPTPDPRMRFCPESIVWYEMSKKYKERLVDISVRKYYKDTTNAITGRSFNRAVSNYYGWKYGVNNLLPYIFYSPKEVLKNFIGLSMDGFKTNRSIKTILGDAHTLTRKALVFMFIPVGYILSKIK